MFGSVRATFPYRRLLHTWRPSEALKRKIAESEKARRNKKNPKKDEILVDVPESKAFLDSATMPMVLTAVAVALFAKVLMMYDESKTQERIERKIRNAPAEQGTVRMLSREEWDEIQEIRPRTPFESKLARPNARLRTGEPLRVEDVKDWSIDVLTDALTRVEESVNRKTK
ncbi:cytoplasmic dynein 2 light intermediate chain [Tasmannia lanceolata]|uniref:cytoplasmic dynein 2 light intermediate chain n=1 Tax=Tasmannia lanceolata TaxID=3420 RepID=UPI004064ABD8